MPRADDHFVLTAVVFGDVNRSSASAFLADLRTDIRRDPGQELTWKKIGSHADRLHVAKSIGAQSWLTICTVVFCKRRLVMTSMGDNQLYCYAFRYLLERISWLAEGRRRQLAYTLAHIKHFSLKELRAYEAKLRAIPGCSINWSYLDPAGGAMDQPNRQEFLQLADLAASAAGAAFNSDAYGNTEDRYLREMGDRLYRGTRGNGDVTKYGLKIHPWEGETTKAAYPWVAALA
jgi:hypothetical protein